MPPSGPDGSRAAAPGPGALPALPVPALSVRGLRKSYRDRTVLDGIDLDVTAGQLVAVLGANGSGKSTLLRCVTRLETPDTGQVLVHGTPIATAPHDPLSRGRRPDVRLSRTAMIFQQIHLVRRRSAIDNVCAGALGRLPLHQSLSPLLFPQHLREEAMTCLDRVGMADRAGERASRLSGGQQQRVAIARALCQRADIILADEPVAALDPSATRAVLTLLAELAHHDGLAVVVVLHHPDLALAYADRIIGLRDGRIRIDAAAASLSGAHLQRLYSADHPPVPAVAVTARLTDPDDLERTASP